MTKVYANQKNMLFNKRFVRVFLDENLFDRMTWKLKKYKTFLCDILAFLEYSFKLKGEEEGSKHSWHPAPPPKLQTAYVIKFS